MTGQMDQMFVCEILSDLIGADNATSPKKDFEWIRFGVVKGFEKIHDTRFGVVNSLVQVFRSAQSLGGAF